MFNKNGHNESLATGRQSQTLGVKIVQWILGEGEKG